MTLIVDDRPITRQACHHINRLHGDGTLIFRSRVGHLSYKNVVTAQYIQARPISDELQSLYQSEMRRMGVWEGRLMDDPRGNIYHNVTLNDEGKLSVMLFNYGCGQWGQRFDLQGSLAVWEAHKQLVQTVEGWTPGNLLDPVELLPTMGYGR